MREKEVRNGEMKERKGMKQIEKKEIKEKQWRGRMK
jgi:hypothetical protein